MLEEISVPEFTILTLLQIIVGLGLLNVWLIRAGSATDYRGGEATTLKEEFQAYGLPDGAFYLVGAMKIGLVSPFWQVCGRNSLFVQLQESSHC